MEQIAGLPLTPVESRTLCRSRRRVRGRVRPRTADEVAAVVAACARAGQAVYPISGGKNWGMGSYLPNRDGCVLLDLSELKGIGPLDREAAAVRLEAGVTQRDLYQYLQQNAPELAMNVTGAGQDTSIVGNALERGLGYAGSRAAEFFGLEAVLADGSIHRPEAEWFSLTGHPTAGPQLDPLFAQNNLGVVTAGWLQLRRRQEMEAAVILTGELEPVLATVVEAFHGNLFTLPIHMGGGSRTDAMGRGFLRQLWRREPTLADVRRVFPLSRGHNALGALHGPRRLVRAAVAELRTQAAPGVRVRVATEARLRMAERWCRRLGLGNRATFFAAMRPLLALTWGEANDSGLAALDVSLARPDPDELADGCIYLNAITPLALAPSLEVERLVAEAFPDYALTRCGEPRALVHVISVFFPAAEAEEAHQRVRSLAAALRQRGYPPYRLGLPTMVTTPDKLALAVKHSLDPAGIIAPDHYVP